MSELRKANTDSSYFITLTVAGWIDIFTKSVYSEIILDSLEFCRKNKGLEVFGFVIMPSFRNKMKNISSGRKRIIRWS